MLQESMDLRSAIILKESTRICGREWLQRLKFIILYLMSKMLAISERDSYIQKDWEQEKKEGKAEVKIAGYLCSIIVG